MSQTQDKYCVLPGQEPVRLSSLSGHIVIIGETPRTIPAEFEQEARSKGCFTETQLEDLTRRLAPSDTQAQAADLLALAAKDNAANTDANAQRLDKIKQAVIEILNNGDPKLIDKKGRPELKAVAEKVGFDVTQTEVDSAYDAAIKG